MTTHVSIKNCSCESDFCQSTIQYLQLRIQAHRMHYWEMQIILEQNQLQENNMEGRHGDSAHNIFSVGAEVEVTRQYLGIRVILGNN